MCDAIRRHCVELGISFAAPDQHVIVKIDNNAPSQQSQVQCCTVTHFVHSIHYMYMHVIYIMYAAVRASFTHQLPAKLWRCVIASYECVTHTFAVLQS
jgi:hypothetical protein